MRDKLEIKVCKDIFKYRESIALGLNLRQILCSCLAVVMAVGIYFLTKNILGKETASWLCIVGASPFAVAGFFNYNGLTIEKFIGEMIHTSLNSTMRYWVGENSLYQNYKNWSKIR
jgi:hypothetical protein